MIVNSKIVYLLLRREYVSWKIGHLPIRTTAGTCKSIDDNVVSAIVQSYDDTDVTLLVCLSQQR